MYTPSLTQALLTGLVAASAVASYDVSSPVNGLSRRSVAAILAVAGPVLAAPTVIERTPEPHHKGVKAGGKKGGKRDVDDEEDDIDLDTRVCIFHLIYPDTRSRRSVY